MMSLLKLPDTTYRESCAFILSGYVRASTNKSVIIIIEHSPSFVLTFFGSCPVKFLPVYIIR